MHDTGGDYSAEPVETRRPFKALLDVGLIKTTTGDHVFGALKVLDGGTDIPHSEKRFARFNKNGKQLDVEVHRKCIFGGHVSSYCLHEDFNGRRAKKKYQTHFSDYIKAGVKPITLKSFTKRCMQPFMLIPPQGNLRSRLLSNTRGFLLPLSLTFTIVFILIHQRMKPVRPQEDRNRKNSKHCCLHKQQWYQSPRFKLGRNLGIVDSRRTLKRDDWKPIKNSVWNKHRTIVLDRFENLELTQEDEESKAKHMARKMKKARCYTCKKKGHVFWNCRNQRNKHYRKALKIAEILNQSEFWNCKRGRNAKSEPGMMNHDAEIAKEDRIKSEFKRIEGDSMVLGTDSGNWDLIWYVSKTSHNHMASTMNTFINHKPIFDKIIGEALVTTKDRSFIIPYVTYVPNLGINILSLSQLTTQGLEVEFLENRCVLKPMFDKEFGGNTSSKTRNEQHADEGSLQEKLEELERIVSIDITKRMLVEYATRNYDEVGESSNIGLFNDSLREMVVPSDLNHVVEFLDQILIGKYAKNLKDEYASNFDTMLEWFYRDFLDCPLGRKIPPLVGNKRISLMDLFRTINEMGGAGTVLVKGKWEELAIGLGYSKEVDDEIKNCYLEYLQQLDVYYNVARKLLEEDKQNYVMWNGIKTKLETNTIEGFMVFMGMLKHTPTEREDKRHGQMVS